MVEFSDLLRPPLEKLFPGGFQGAHIIGREFWKGQLGFLTEILGEDAFNKTLNGVLLPANGAGGAILGVASHRGPHVEAFNKLFYEVGGGTSSKRFLNVLDRQYKADLIKAELAGLGQDGIGKIKAKYAFKTANYLDFMKVLFLEQSALNEIDPSLKAIALNSTDHRFKNAGEVTNYGDSYRNYSILAP